jgi:hypothetical protein
MRELNRSKSNRPHEAAALSLWPSFALHLVPLLTAVDDPALWQIAIDTVLGDAVIACEGVPKKTRIIAQIGCCSHWLAPNKARWVTSDGEFAWPSGYQPKAGYWGGLPEFDWHLAFEREEKQNIWRHIPKVRAKRPLFLRVAIPARTALHLRASIAAMWAPGPKPELIPARLFYGFRKLDSVWRRRAYQGPKRKSPA